MPYSKLVILKKTNTELSKVPSDFFLSHVVILILLKTSQITISPNPIP